jgi:hypothetical protein
VAPALFLRPLGFVGDQPCRESNDGRFGDRGGEESGDEAAMTKFRRGEAYVLRSLLVPVEETDESEDTERADGRIVNRS